MENGEKENEERPISENQAADVDSADGVPDFDIMDFVMSAY